MRGIRGCEQCYRYPGARAIGLMTLPSGPVTVTVTSTLSTELSGKYAERARCTIQQQYKVTSRKKYAGILALTKAILSSRGPLHTKGRSPLPQTREMTTRQYQEFQPS